MRLFIAINFDDRVKGVLKAAQSKLKEQALSGNFTKDENLHLTIVFLGEVERDRLAEISRVMNESAVKPFTINIQGVGRFRRGGGDLWWMGVDGSEELAKLHTQLIMGLRECGFALQNREFTPHLTLAREVSGDIDKAALSGGISGISFDVHKISLMKSERINGRLTYTAVYEKHL